MGDPSQAAGTSTRSLPRRQHTAGGCTHPLRPLNVSAHNSVAPLHTASFSQLRCLLLLRNRGRTSHGPGIVTGAPQGLRTLARASTEPSGASVASREQRLASPGPARATHQEAPSHPQSRWGQKNRTSTAGMSCNAETRGGERLHSHTTVRVKCGHYA